MRVDELLALDQYSLRQEDKQTVLTERLRDLTLLHRERCEPYRRILAAFGHEPAAIDSLLDVPMLPVGLFKSHVLRSVPKDRVFKVVTSSGTGGAVSLVHLDTAGARRQTRALAGIMKHWLGSSRLPMIVVDARSTVSERRSFSARGAGIIGMSTFGRDHLYALDEHMRLDRDRLREWLACHAGSDILLFGFTFMVWEHFVKALASGEADLGRGVLVHSGGWKKLADHSITDEQFKSELAQVTGLRRVHNFYGMAEQTGTVFVECEEGLLHAPNASDVLVRDPASWNPVPDGEVGVAQMLSALPESYPGHSVLTEDLVRVEAVDSCGCGRRGKAVSVVGRVPEAELRGCSDTHSEHAEVAV